MNDKKEWLNETFKKNDTNTNIVNYYTYY
jgi:hypothetical protein